MTVTLLAVLMALLGCLYVTPVSTRSLQNPEVLTLELLNEQPSNQLKLRKKRENQPFELDTSANCILCG